MNFSLNETQRLYVDTVQKFVKAEITPRVQELEKEHVFPVGIMKKAWKKSQ